MLRGSVLLEQRKGYSSQLVWEIWRTLIPGEQEALLETGWTSTPVVSAQKSGGNFLALLVYIQLRLVI